MIQYTTVCADAHAADAEPRSRMHHPRNVDKRVKHDQLKAETALSLIKPQLRDTPVRDSDKRGRLRALFLMDLNVLG